MAAGAVDDAGAAARVVSSTVLRNGIGIRIHDDVGPSAAAGGVASSAAADGMEVDVVIGSEVMTSRRS